MQRKLELAALAFALTTSVAIAQQRDPNVPRNTNPPGTAGQQAAQASQQQLDAQIANCLILGNQEEIALCKFALEQSNSDEVKELARKMIEDHQGFMTKLQRYASKNQNFELRTTKTNSDGSKSDSPIRQVGGTRNEERETSPTTAAGTVSASPHADRLFAIEKQAHEECLRLTQECLSEHHGDHFDQAFLGQQISAHIGMLAKMKAAEDDVSPEFGQLLKDGQKTAKTHKEHVEKLMHSESKDSKRSKEVKERKSE